MNIKAIKTILDKFLKLLLRMSSVSEVTATKPTDIHYEVPIHAKKTKYKNKNMTTLALRLINSKPVTSTGGHKV